MIGLAPQARYWLANATGLPAASITLAPMAGATSSTLYRVADGSGLSTRRFVLRLFTLAEWLAEEPDLAQHEAAALQEAAKTNLPVPELVAFLPGPSSLGPDDPVGFGAPAVLMTLLAGRVELTPDSEDRWLESLANTLAQVHSHSAPNFGWRYRSWVQQGNVKVPDYAHDTGLWEAAVHAYVRWRPAAAGESFLHRDFHAMNVLFTGHGASLRASGVVDWVNACVGPPASDVAHCRIDLTQMKGVAAAEAFTREYFVATGKQAYDPAWDLEAAFDVAVPKAQAHAPWREFGLAHLRPQTVQARVEEFVARALVDLGVR